MKREAGVTLIELLATLSIAIIFVGTIFLTFSKVSLNWNSDINNYNDESQARLAMDTITKSLVDSDVLVYESYPISGNTNKASEIRFISGVNNGLPTYKAIVYLSGTGNTGTLTIYTFTGNSNDFVDNNGDVNYGSNPEYYTNGITLAKNVDNKTAATLPFYQDSQGNPLSSGNALTNGNLINIQIPFYFKNIGTQIVRTSVKLLSDK